LTEQCEYVVIAGPSPTIEPATLVLAELADATVMIAQHGVTRLRDAERAGTRLRRVGGAVLGVLVDPARPGTATAASVPRATGVSAG
jgi:Mrp family chromosome partitioning ATPase